MQCRVEASLVPEVITTHGDMCAEPGYVCSRIEIRNSLKTYVSGVRNLHNDRKGIFVPQYAHAVCQFRPNL